MAELARPFACGVLAADPLTRRVPAHRASPMAELLPRADIVVCLAISDAATRGLFGAEAFARMKPGARFINLSRGELVDEAALAAALDGGHLAGAAMDVGRAPDQRPSAALARRPDVVATPHLGGMTPEAMEHQAMDTVRQVAALARGEWPENAVNAAAAHRLRGILPPLDAPRRPAAHSAAMGHPRLLLLGCGAFGRVHLAAHGAAWRERPAGVRHRIPASPPPPAGRGGQCARPASAACDAAIVRHAGADAMRSRRRCCGLGRDLFLEKPATSPRRRRPASPPWPKGRPHRPRSACISASHPKASVAARGMVAAGAFGAPASPRRALLLALKRARGESGALLNDAVHFADLLPWIAGEAPARVFATLADPLGRGREDLAVVQMCSPRADGADRGRLRACPAAGRMLVVPGAETRKELLPRRP